MKSINQITVLGNLGRDAETRMTTNNLAITSFSIATTNSYKGKDDNWINDTTWHNVTGFRVSDYVKETLKKGATVYVQGRLQKREYEDKDGQKRQSVEIIANEIIPMAAKANGSSSAGQEESFVPDPVESDDLPF